jgi:anthranilate/para-aminobenzoate synthase component II
MEQSSQETRVLVIRNVDPLPPGFATFFQEACVELDVLDYREIRGHVVSNRYHGVILSGTDLSPHLYPEIYRDEGALVRSCKKPMLGICGGFQIIATEWGAPIGDAHQPVYGRTEVRVLERNDLFNGLGSTFQAFSKHRYCVKRPPIGFRTIAESVQGNYVYAVKQIDAPIYGVQFHPERRLEAAKVLHNFLGIIRNHRTTSWAECANV